MSLIMNIYSSPFLRRTFAVAAALALFFAQDVHAQTAADRIKLLETTLQDLLKRDEEKDRLLKEMAAKLKSLGGDSISHEASGKGHAHEGTDPGHAEKGDSVFAKKVGDTNAPQLDRTECRRNGRIFIRDECNVSYFTGRRA